MVVLLVVVLILFAALVWFGLRGWERLVHHGRRYAAWRQGEGPGPDEGPAVTATAEPRPVRLPSATWLVVASNAPREVATGLRLRTVLPAAVDRAFGEVAQSGVFVAPAVGGRVLVCGRDLDRIAGEPETLQQLVEQVGRQCGGAVAFVADDHREYHGWVLAPGGAVERAFVFAGEHGPILWEGDVTAAERALGCFVDDPQDQSDDEHKWWPDRRLVLALARHWRADPAALLAALGGGDEGLIGRL